MLIAVFTRLRKSRAARPGRYLAMCSGQLFGAGWLGSSRLGRGRPASRRGSSLHSAADWSAPLLHW